MDCLVAAVLRFHSELLKGLETEDIDKSSNSQQLKPLILTSILSSSQEVHKTLLKTSLLLDNAYVHDARQFLGQTPLRALLDCTLSESQVYPAKQNLSALRLPLVYMLTATFYNIYQFDEALQPESSPLFTAFLYQDAGPRHMLLTLLNHMIALLFFIRLNPNSHLATVCFGILRKSLRVAVSGQNVDVLLPSDGKLVMDTMDQTGLIDLALYSKEGLRFLFSLASLLEDVHHYALITQMREKTQISPKFLFSRRLRVISHICKTSASRPHVCTAYLQPVDLLTLQSTAIDAIFTMLNCVEEYETFIWALKSSLSCLREIVFSRVSPVHISRTSGSLRTMYRSTGFLYALEKLDVLLSKEGTGLHEISLALAFYVDCIQRLASLRCNLIAHQASSSKGGKLVVKSDLTSRLLSDKLENVLLSILTRYFSITVSLDTLDSDFLVCTLIKIFQWAPVRMDAVFNLFLGLIKTNIKRHMAADNDAAFLLHLMLILYRVCLAIGAPAGSTWLDQAEAHCIAMIIYVALPFIYKECIPFLQSLHTTLSPEDVPIFQEALLGLLGVSPTVYRSITRELIDPSTPGSSLHTTCKTIYNECFTAPNETASLTTAKFLDSFLSVSWVYKGYSSMLQQQMFKLLCDNLISFLEFAYVSTLCISEPPSGNVFLDVYSRVVREVIAYGGPCLEVVLLCMLFQHITLGHFNRKEHQLVAFWKASTSVELIHLFDYVLVEFEKLSISPQNVLILMLILIGEMLNLSALLEETIHEAQPEQYVRGYDFDLRTLLRKIMTLVLSDKSVRLDLVHQCLVFLCASSMSCYIISGSLFQGIPSFLSVGGNKRSLRGRLQSIRDSSHSYQAGKWSKLVSRDFTVFQSASYDLVLHDPAAGHDDISIRLLFLSTPSLTLWKASSHRSLRCIAASLEYLHELTTGGKACFSRLALNLFIRSCILSGEQHTLRIIADFIAKVNIFPAFFSAADEDSPLDVRLLALLLKQSSSLILHNAVARYLLKQLGSELPCYYLLTERQEASADEDGMLRFLSYFNVLFQIQVHPLLEPSPDQVTQTLQAEAIVPGNFLILRSGSSPLKRARKTVSLSSLNATIFTYCHVKNSYTMTLTLTIHKGAGDTTRPQPEAITLTIWIQDGSVFFSTSLSTSSSKYIVPLDEGAEWIYIEATFSPENLVLLCYTVLSKGDSFITSVPLDIDASSSLLEARLDIDAAIRLLYLSDDAFCAVNSVAVSYPTRIYPVAIYTQQQNDRQHFQRFQAPTFTWAYAETIGYSFIMYDDTADGELVRAIMPQDVWNYDISGLFQILSLLFLGENGCSGKTPRYKQEFEPALLLKLLHMLQDAEVEEIFSRACGYKLLIAYFSILHWPLRMQALHVVVVFTRLLFEFILSSQRESHPHLLLLLTKLYHELIIVPVALYFPDASPSKEVTELQSWQWTVAEQSFYVKLCQLHHMVFSEGYYLLRGVGERTAPVCFIMYQLLLFCRVSDEIANYIGATSYGRPMEQFIALLRRYSQDNDTHTIMLVQLLKCMSLPFPVTTSFSNRDLIALIYDLYTNAVREEAYSIIKAVPVVADLYFYEKMLLLPVILSIDDVAVSSTLTRLIWKDWAPRKEAIPELLIGIEQLLESTDFSVSEEPILKTFTTLYGITDFFAFLLFNLLVKGQYDRFEKMLVTYAVLPLVADESVSCPSSLASLRHVLGLSDELLYTEYIHMTTGLVSLAALALFSQVGADVLSLLGLDEASRNYSALDGSVSLLRKILDMMAALLDHFTTTHSYIATTISILRSVCVFAKSDDDPAEFLQELATRLSSANGLATVWQSAPLSLVCTCLNTYSKAAAEQLHKKLDVLRTSASIDVLPFSTDGNSARWTPYLPDELRFCPIGNPFINMPSMQNARADGDSAERYVCPGCLSSIALQGLSLEMIRAICGNVCIICSYTPKYRSPKTIVASVDSFGIFSTLAHLEMMNASADTAFSLDGQTKTEGRHKGGDLADSSTALHLFYQKYLYSRESIVAHFFLPHPIYKQMHHLSSQKLVLLSPSVFSYPSVRLSPTFIQSDVNGRLADSCLTDIGGALPPLSSTSLRQYSVTNTSTSRHLIEFGDVLVVSLVYTGYGVLSLRVSSDLIDKAEKQAPPMGEQIVITDKYREKMCFSVVDTEPNFVAYTGHQSQTFLFNWARFDQRSESDADDSTGALQAADEPANSAIKEHQEAESFSILRRLLCTKDNPRSIYLENSFSRKQDSFGRRISYGLYDYCMSTQNRAYHKYKEVELSIEYSRILYMVPFFFIRMQPALQIIESNGAVHVLLFKTQEHAVKLIHNYGYYRRFGCGESGSGSAYGTCYYYSKSPYKKKGVLLDFETIVSTFQAELLGQLRLILGRRISLLMANNTISLTMIQFSVFTLLSAMNMIAARSPVVSYIYPIFPALSPRKSAKPRNLRYSLPAQSNTSLCKSIAKYAEMSLGELQSTSLQDKMAATAFLNDILKQSMQTLEKAATASSEDAISFFRKGLERANLSPSAMKLLSASPLFRTFISNNMTLPYYCFCVEPFTSLQRNLQGGCLDAFSRLFISLRSHWEKVELGSSFHEAIPELFYTPYIFTNTNGLQLSSDAETVTEALQSTPSQAIDTVHAQRTALESTILSNQAGQGGLRSWIELLFGSKQQSLDALNLFPSGTAEYSPGEASIATSLYFGTYPIRLHQDELSKLLALMDNVHKPTKMAEELVLTYSVDIRRYLHTVPFEQLTPGSVQGVTEKCDLIFRHFNQPALCVAGRHVTLANHINGLLWTTKDCIVIDTYMLYFDINRQEISVFELSKVFLDSFHVTPKGGSGGLSSVFTGGNLGREQESGNLNTPDQLLSGAQHPPSGPVVILGFSHASGSQPRLLTNIPVTQLAKQGKTIGMHITTFKLASTLGRRCSTSKNAIITKIDSAGYMPFYEYVLHLYTDQGIILANIRNLSTDAQPQLFIIQHCPLDVGYYSRLAMASFLHVPELSLVCYYSPHVLHVLEYNSLHRTVSYGSRETDSPYLLAKFRISYEEKLAITYCAVHERQGLIAVGLSVLNDDTTVDSERTLQYCIYLYTLGNIHIKALSVPAPVQHIAFFGGYDDGFAGYMLVNKQLVYSLDSDVSEHIRKVCETEILADSLAVVDGAIVGYQRETFRWYS